MSTLGVWFLQFTKQGSIFLCIRLVDTSGYDSASAPPSQLLDLVDSKHRKVGSELPALSMESIDLETEALDDSFTAIHVNGHVDKGVPGVTSKRSRLRRSTQTAPPRLSMKPGPLSSKSCVVKWREWKSISTLEADEVCVLISIEDTGVCFKLFFINLKICEIKVWIDACLINLNALMYVCWHWSMRSFGDADKMT